MEAIAALGATWRPASSDTTTATASAMAPGSAKIQMATTNLPGK
jgi:hypothetical protein